MAIFSPFFTMSAFFSVYLCARISPFHEDAGYIGLGPTLVTSS